jgi:LIVCS family branched-chain amino acid:cation transporter
MLPKPKIFPLGLAIFTMLFGAGNVVFPLTLGRDVGDKIWFAIAGFFITAVLVPLLGLVSAMLFEGDYKKFLAQMGTIPGGIVCFICMLLLGPVVAPRCITLSYSAVSWYIPRCPLLVFSLGAATLIFVLTLHKNKVVALFSKVLGPLKLILLFSIIVLGLLSPLWLEPTTISSAGSFFKGLKEGYYTLDLLGTIFFASLIYAAIASQYAEESGVNDKAIVHIGLKAGLIGGSLLGIVYLGFCFVAAMYGPHVYDVPQEKILFALASLILGHKGGVLANMTVAVACMITAMALTTVFADYLSNEIFQGKVRYAHALLITVIIVFAMANLGFSGLMAVIEPIVVVGYPALIALALGNMANKLFGFRWTRPVVYVTFIGSFIFYHGHWVMRFFA